MNEVEKIMELVFDHSDLLRAQDRGASIYYRDIDEAKRKIRAAVEALVAERDLRTAECDDIAELNHAQWLALENVRTLAQRNRTEDWAQHMLRFCESAGSRAVILRQKAKPQVQQEPQERECECCNGTGVINERLGGEWSSNPAAKCPDCDGDGVWEAKAQVQQEPPGMAVQALAGEIVDALMHDEKDCGYDLEGGLFGPAFSTLVRRWAVAEAKAQVQQEPYGYLNTKKCKFAFVDDGAALLGKEYKPLYAAPVNDKLREAVQKALELARDGAIESLIEALEAMK